MDKMTCTKIKDVLNQKHNLYIDLAKVLEAEQKAITDMDVNFLWNASSMKKKIAAGIESLRGGLLAFLDETGIDHGISLGSFSMSRLLKILPVDPIDLAELEKIIIDLNGIKENVQRLARYNRRYIQEYLSIIDGVMTTITGAARQEQYGEAGKIHSASGYGSSASIPLIYAEA